MTAAVVKTAGEDILGVGNGIEMLSSSRQAERLDSMDPRIPWFHPSLVPLLLTPRPNIRKQRKTVMQVAVKLEGVASSGGTAGQAHIAVATHQVPQLYEAMSVTLSNCRHIKSEMDIGVSETTQRWAWNDHGYVR